MASISWTRNVQITSGPTPGTTIQHYTPATGVLVPAGWIVGGGTAYVVLVTYHPTGPHAGRFFINLDTTSTSTPGSGTSAGPEFLPAVEAGIRITVEFGEHTAIIDGVQDATEPYAWIIQAAAQTVLANMSNGDSATVTLTYPVNVAPVADAGDNQTVASGATVTLDGSGSTDSDAGDSIASYLWSQVSGPTVALSSTTVVSPTFTAPTVAPGAQAISLVFRLIVTDTQGASSPASTVTITVQAPAFPGGVTVRQNGVLRKAAGLYVREAGVLRTIQKAYIRQGGVLREVFRR